MRIDARIEDREALRRLRRVARSAEDAGPLMLAISEHLKASVERSFDRQAAPDGGAWPALRPATARARARAGYGAAGPMLVRRGDLLRSIASDSGRDWAAAGTNLVYAATHQFGRDAIPARPFLGLWPEERGEIEEDAREWLLRGAAGL